MCYVQILELSKTVHCIHRAEDNGRPPLLNIPIPEDNGAQDAVSDTNDAAHEHSFGTRVKTILFGNLRSNRNSPIHDSCGVRLTR